MDCKFCKSSNTIKDGIKIKPSVLNEVRYFQKHFCKDCGRTTLGDEVKKK